MAKRTRPEALGSVFDVSIYPLHGAEYRLAWQDDVDMTGRLQFRNLPRAFPPKINISVHRNKDLTNG